MAIAISIFKVSLPYCTDNSYRDVNFQFMSSIRYDPTLCNFSLLGMLEDKQHLHLDTFTFYA